MEISEQLSCLFSAAVEETADSYVIEVPATEITEGFVDEEEIHQVALLSTERRSVKTKSPDRSLATSDARSDAREDGEIQDPPVSQGEERIVEISETGNQGDGLTRVERGFVVIVPETQVGDRVRITIETVRDTVAFGEVIEQIEYKR